MKRILININLLLLLLVMPVIAVHAGELSVGEKAVDFPESGNWFGGAATSVADNLGKKVTLLYFMKPGCGSCDKFAPHLYRLLLQNKDDLSVIGVTEYTSDKIEEYLQKRVGDYPIFQDMIRSFMNQYIGTINKYPYVAVIDKEGVLTWFGRGKFHSQVTEEVERALGKIEPQKCLNPAGKKNALVVGVDYSTMVLQKLPAAQKSAQVVSEAFKEAKYSSVTELLGSDASKEAVLDGMEKLAGLSGLEDTAVVYLSGDAKPQKLSDGSIDLELYLPASGLSLKELVAAFTAKSECKNLMLVIDANNEKSSLKIWEDIAADVGSAVPEATVILSAARWDRSMNAAGGDVTNFAEYFALEIKDSTPEFTPYELWRDIRDRMSVWSRPHGILQSPFIANAKPFSIGNAE